MSLAIGIALLVLLTLWLLPAWQVTHTPGTTAQVRFDREDKARSTLAQLVGGGAILFGLFMSLKTFGLSREGQITDRFTKAIEQLGKIDGDRPSIEVRLGGIYALERIAIDSPRDHWTIMEVLTAYIRQNAPLDPDRPCVTGEKPRTDIQAILTVLGRRPIGPTRERPNLRLDLSGSRLCGACLDGANLEGAVLSKTNLEGAVLRGANMQGANLRKAEMRFAELPKANLQRAKLQEADLRGAWLVGANLQEASLNLAKLKKADLTVAKMQGANLPGANLAWATLTRANLQGADLFKTDFEGADLRDANLQGANLDRADMGKVFYLTVGHVKSAKNWELAHYSPEFRAELGLPSEPSIENRSPTH